MGERELRVVAGAVIASRFFDVADAIDLAAAERLWARQPRSAMARGRLVSTPPKAVAFGVPPLDIPLAPVQLRLDGLVVPADPTARLFDFGVARLALRVAADALPWTGFVERLGAVDREVGPGAANGLWNELFDQLRAIFGEAFLQPARSSLEEDYLVGLVRTFDEAPSAASLQQRLDLVPLLSGETRPLSDGARRDLLRQNFSYYTDDLVVLTWDRAFVYEPRGDSDVIDVLDVANAQLLETRYYDRLLDVELPRMYDLVQATQRARSLASSRRFATLARRLYALVAEVTELRAKADNALQVTEDVYLARVYTAALDVFRVAAVGASVDRKLAIIRATYTALYEESSNARAALLEATIVVLILFEIVLALLRP